MTRFVVVEDGEPVGELRTTWGEAYADARAVAVRLALTGHRIGRSRSGFIIDPVRDGSTVEGRRIDVERIDA